MKAYRCCCLLLTVAILLSSCSHRANMRQTLNFAGDNGLELEKVVMHYKSLRDKQKVKAAEFLIANIGVKHSYKGDILSRYDTIFSIYDSLCQKKIYDREPKVVVDMWHDLVKEYGNINPAKLQKVYDCQTLSAEFLIQNIDEAFDAWRKSPLYNPNNFNLFCEYVLPYRIANETPEVYRKRYYSEVKFIIDTVTSAEGILQGFSAKYYKQYISANILWDYPIELSISEMERSHHGACRHLTTFCGLVMRAGGLPVTTDRAIWANRSLGHTWNVLMLDSGKILPFDAFDKRRITFAYKPAKIHRKTYSYNFDVVNKLRKNADDVPSSFFILDEKDVTHEYVKAYDVVVPISFPYKGKKKKKLGVICVFDNTSWRVVHWGEIKYGKMFFKNMASDVAYIGAYYENGEIIPATAPFLLYSDGTVKHCKASKTKISMMLKRKYPLSKLMMDRAYGLMEMSAEGANDLDFRKPAVFFTQAERVYEVTDLPINNPNTFRYVRLNIAVTRNANLAEVEFYGKKSVAAKEEKLTGKIFGFPPLKADLPNPYINAMDGNLETFFGKDKRSKGWVGIDLGQKYHITRIRYCPRSDTNFILEGDTYELMYWHENQWRSIGKKVASQYNSIVLDSVPASTMYLLHNQSRGKEERIFTYEDGKQVWW